jgi:hypothetical protein
MRVLSLALVVATLASVCSPASALYTKKDAVVQLDPSNWEDEIGSSNEYWIVEFYAPWCAARVYQGRSQAGFGLPSRFVGVAVERSQACWSSHQPTLKRRLVCDFPAGKRESPESPAAAISRLCPLHP